MKKTLSLARAIIIPLFVGVSALILSSCASKAPSSQSLSPTDKNEHGMMDGAMMGGVAMHTEALQLPCDELKALTVTEKATLLTTIGHNMDMGALDKLMGPGCATFGPTELVKMKDLTNTKLKLNPNDTETLYYVTTTNQFFVTCASLDTIAYVVDGDSTASSNPMQFFLSHESEFAEAASMARDMMGSMDNTKDEMMESTENTSAFMYEEYSDAAFASLKGTKPFALFFYADWCPMCRKTEADIKANLSTMPANTAILKADYDTEITLKQQYGITVQSTLVFFDAAGNVTGKKTNPTLGEIQSSLTSA